MTLQAKLPRVMVACTHLTLLQGVSKALGLDHEIEMAENGWVATDRLQQDEFKIALLDVNLPGLSGFDVAKRISRLKYDGVPNLPVVVLVTVGDAKPAQAYVTEGFADGALVFPMSDGEALTEIWAAADRRVEASWETLNPVQKGLLRVTRHSVAKLADMAQGKAPIDNSVLTACSSSLVEAARGNDLTSALELLKGHHNYTFVHALKVASFMTIFAGAVGVSRQDMELLAQAGLMHDVGKSLTPVALLNKPGRLEGEEWDVMQRHAILSAEVLRDKMEANETMINVAERHHERLDGSGYPFGLKGTEIDDMSLICAIADVYSALTDKRAYKRAMSQDEAFAIMDGMAGPHLEPTFYRKFREVLGDQALAVA